MSALSNVTPAMIGRRVNAAPQLPNTPAPYGWVEYHGPHGGLGWKNLATGQVIYATSGQSPFHNRMRAAGKKKSKGNLHPGVLKRHRLSLRKLAEWYARHWNELRQGGLEVPAEEQKEAQLELHGSGVKLEQIWDGSWLVMGDRPRGKQVQYADEEGPSQPAEPKQTAPSSGPKPTMASPKVGTGKAAGKEPSASQGPLPVLNVHPHVMGTEEHQAARQSRMEAGPVNETELRGHLGHAAAHELAPEDLTAAEEQHRVNVAHHGEGAYHRLAQRAKATATNLEQVREARDAQVRELARRGVPNAPIHIPRDRAEQSLLRELAVLRHQRLLLQRNRMTTSAPMAEGQGEEHLRPAEQVAGAAAATPGGEQQPVGQQPVDEFPPGSSLWDSSGDSGNDFFKIVRSPNGGWEYSDPERKRIAGTVPHAQVMKWFQSGQIERKAAQEYPIGSELWAGEGEGHKVRMRNGSWTNVGPTAGQTRWSHADVMNMVASGALGPKGGPAWKQLQTNLSDHTYALDDMQQEYGPERAAAKIKGMFAGLPLEQRRLLSQQMGLGTEELTHEELMSGLDDLPDFEVGRAMSQRLSAREAIDLTPEAMSQAYIDRIRQARELAQRIEQHFRQTQQQDTGDAHEAAIHLGREVDAQMRDWPDFQRNYLGQMIGMKPSDRGIYDAFFRHFIREETFRRANPDVPDAEEMPISSVVSGNNGERWIKRGHEHWENVGRTNTGTWSGSGGIQNMLHEGLVTFEPPSAEDQMQQSYEQRQQPIPANAPLPEAPQEPTGFDADELALDRLLNAPTGEVPPANAPLPEPPEEPRGMEEWMGEGQVLPMAAGIANSTGAGPQYPQGGEMPQLQGAAAELHGEIRNGIRTSTTLTPEARQSFATSSAKVLARMSPTAVQQIRQNTAGGFVYAESPQMLIGEFARTVTGPLPIDPTRNYGGLYDEANGRVFIDGRGGEGTQTEEEIHAHELGHSIDGRTRQFSSMPEWIAAYDAEIARGQLSPYAAARSHKGPAAQASEGFAEFSRLLHSGDVPLDVIRQRFPKALAFWEQHSLVGQQSAESSASQKQPPTAKLPYGEGS